MESLDSRGYIGAAMVGVALAIVLKRYEEGLPGGLLFCAGLVGPMLLWGAILLLRDRRNPNCFNRIQDEITKAIDRAYATGNPKEFDPAWSALERYRENGGEAELYHAVKQEVQTVEERLKDKIRDEAMGA